MKQNKFYITTPIYYVNSKPHVGTLYSTLLADVAARWNKLMGKQVMFVTGSDEHGQKIQEKAEQMGMTPQAFCDSMIPDFKRMWEKYEIEYDQFVRTTSENHKQAVIAWIKKMQELDQIYKSVYTGLYCVPCETFVTPSSEIMQDETGKSLCPTCKRALREVSEESYFFRLSAYQDKLLKFYEEHPDFITPKERMNEVISFVKSGLKDLSISRKTVSWGIPFPGDPEHTVYVWGDALNNYVSIVGGWQDNPQAQANFAQWWPADVHVMAKDIVRFHAVFWPAFLMASELALPKKLLVHGYILMGEHKMSKSLGNTIDPDQLAQWYGVEPVRYYLLRQMPINQDGQFDLKSLEDHISADLANNLGNLLNRMTSLAINNNLTDITAPVSLEPVTSALKIKSEEAYKIYWEEMNKYNFHIALAELWKFISEVNAYFHAQQPWVLAKTNKELFAEVIHATCQSLYMIGVLLYPIMPKKMTELLASLGIQDNLTNVTQDYDLLFRNNKWDHKFMLKKTDEPLFVRPESQIKTPEQDNSLTTQAHQDATKKPENLVNQANNTPNITIDDFVKSHIVTGTIMSCEPVSGSDKLYKLQVDMGVMGQRQILSGVAKYFKPEDLINKQAIFVANLAPRKMMGMESQGMMLTASNGAGGMSILSPTSQVPNGTRLT